MGKPTTLIQFENKWNEIITVTRSGENCGVDEAKPTKIKSNEKSIPRSVWINNGGGCDNSGYLRYSITSNSGKKETIMLALFNSDVYIACESPTDNNSPEIGYVVNSHPDMSKGENYNQHFLMIGPHPENSNSGFQIQPTPNGIYNIIIN